MEAFYEGYRALQCTEWEFIVKLDGDLSFSPQYFEQCFEHFRKDPHLGIGGGEIRYEVSGKLIIEANPQFHVRGATKIYRRACWEAIGGLRPSTGWDTIDEVTANMLGWRSSTFPQPHLLHQRLTGSEEGLVHDRLKHGMACYIARYHPLFVVTSCLYRTLRKPYIVGSAAILYGFLKGYTTGSPRVEDPHYVAYIRSQQLRRLFGMKSIWR